MNIDIHVDIYIYMYIYIYIVLINTLVGFNADATSINRAQVVSHFDGWCINHPSNGSCKVVPPVMEFHEWLIIP